jgi:hypothetical protein
LLAYALADETALAPSANAAESAPTGDSAGVLCRGFTDVLVAMRASTGGTCTLAFWVQLAGIWAQCVNSDGTALTWEDVDNVSFPFPTGGADRFYVRVTDITYGETIDLAYRCSGP